MFNWLADTYPQRKARLQLIRYSVGQRLKAVYAFLCRSVSILIIPVEGAGKTIGLSIRIGTLLTLLAFASTLFLSASQVLQQNTVLRSSLAKEQDEAKEVNTQLSELRENVAAYLKNTQQYATQSNIFLNQISSEAISDITEIHIIPDFDFAQKVLAENVQTISELVTYVKTTETFLQSVPSLWPIKSGRGMITNPYGLGPNPFTGKTYMHQGIDITTFRIGEPIVATADGVVLEARFASDLGLYIIIDHAYGFRTIYGHFSDILVRRGQVVERGQTIGYMGTTGLSTGPHVHYEVHIRGAVIDPSAYLAIGRVSSAVNDIRNTNYSVTAIGGTYGSTANSNIGSESSK